MTTAFGSQLRRQLPHKVGILAGTTALLAAGAVGLASPAHADDASTLTVVGTSDVFDSNLVQAVIKPGFEKANPGVTLNYVSKGTGAAIAFAKAGTASALLVHAASVENQFVADGYSAENYGRAVFYGDYVLLGPAGDPAGVLGAGGATSHDIVGAFQKIAAAGANHTARFVSRGGTPGTTIQEHAIWKLTTGVPSCKVSAANGGGTTPSTDPTDPTVDCPASFDNYKLPSWYKATGQTQGPNVLNGDACTYSGDGDSSTNDCYVFTDKGTFQYLRATNAIKNLKILAKNNAATSTGGDTLLVNSFHAYAVNADKFANMPSVQINTAGAKAFLDYLTSPAAQAAVNGYLANDPDGAPFLPSAAPEISYTSLPTSVPLGTTLTVRGNLHNVVPGTPSLNGQAVTLNSAATATSTQFSSVASATTDANGNFAISYKPEQSRIYRLSVGAIDKIENSTLNPVFGDKLAATSVTTNPVLVSTVVTKVTAAFVTTPPKHVTFAGTIGPRVTTNAAYVNLFARKSGTSSYVDYGKRALPANATSFRVAYELPAGSYAYIVRYSNPPRFAPGDSALQYVTAR